jgi:hypothetical protein
MCFFDKTVIKFLGLLVLRNFSFLILSILIIEYSYHVNNISTIT